MASASLVNLLGRQVLHSHLTNTESEPGRRGEETQQPDQAMAPGGSDACSSVGPTGI